MTTLATEVFSLTLLYGLTRKLLSVDSQGKSPPLESICNTNTLPKPTCSRVHACLAFTSICFGSYRWSRTVSTVRGKSRGPDVTLQHDPLTFISGPNIIGLREVLAARRFNIARPTMRSGARVQMPLIGQHGQASTIPLDFNWFATKDAIGKDPLGLDHRYDCNITPCPWFGVQRCARVR